MVQAAGRPSTQETGDNVGPDGAEEADEITDDLLFAPFLDSTRRC